MEGSLKAPLSLIFVQCSSDLSLRLRFFSPFTQGTKSG
nr:MAG TPA: hypothetical protein [Caudoviricetes sp.]